MSKYKLEDLASLIEFQVDDYKPLLILFIDTTKGDLAQIRISLKKKDSLAISSSLHNIKGSALNLGLDTIVGLVEIMSIRNKSELFTDIESVILRFESELSDLEKLLE